MPGSFSGDGSVVWLVEANRVREASCSGHVPRRKKPGRVRQHGIDETDPDQQFTVSIQVPRNPKEADAFIARVAQRAQNLRRGGTLKIELPIEDRRHNKG